MSPTDVPTLTVLETFRLLRLTRPGRLQPWLGPALRGLIAARLKARVCRYPREVQQTERRYCAGCPEMWGWPYGETVEPDPPPGVRVLSGQEAAARPLVIAPDPAPVAGEVGLALPVRVTFVGASASGHAESFWSAAADAGADPSCGFDPDRATFGVEIDPSSPATNWRRVQMPCDASAMGDDVAEVHVRLTGPLFLRSEDEKGRHRLIEHPSFADLLRASLRTLGMMFRLYAAPLPEEIFRPLKERSAKVPTRRSAFGVLRQPKWSNRTGQHGLLTGTVGEAVYGPVPRVLLPWLAWGGRMGVGAHRVAGAGGWETWGDF